MAESSNPLTAKAYGRRDQAIEMAVRLANHVVAEHCADNFLERAIVAASIASRLSQCAVHWLNHELARQEFEKEKKDPAP